MKKILILLIVLIGLISCKSKQIIYSSVKIDTLEIAILLFIAKNLNSSF